MEYPLTPRLGSSLASWDLPLEDDDIVDGYELGGDFSSLVAARVDVNASRFRSVVLSRARLARWRLTDVIVTGGDLSGAALDGVSMRRVEFRDCRMSGVQLTTARLDDVVFSGCKLDGANFRSSTGERVRFDGCLLRDGDFAMTKFKHASFSGCDLKQAEFSKAHLAQGRFGACSLDGSRGFGSLRDITVDRGQALEIAQLLLAEHGITVVDTIDDDTEPVIVDRRS